MKTIHILIIFIILALVQLYVPYRMIKDHEDILKYGTLYQFKTKPIDPNDPFRGKYITLSYEMDSFNSNDTTYYNNNKVYIHLTKDDAGFAQIKGVSHQEPTEPIDYVEAFIDYNDNGYIRFELPFNRYYMEETKALAAEQLYQQVNRQDSIEKVYAMVYVKEGKAVLSDVIIAGESIKDYVTK
ncbi:GDYXXLXY domain-containing protein [Aquimarina brevivitae]|uniref:Putative membrane-anchored protein n=1 Tax=Aquimarina brevivitae TaxID=323412 RepID=A0A4Q7NXZ1_9FLAO|nr:GDYXXLXY domain-containing protein [Aquimarina brevivitae]RZS92165.1 putative membrane-anchored protein [Aquimarina brevivitae]